MCHCAICDSYNIRFSAWYTTPKLIHTIPIMHLRLREIDMTVVLSSFMSEAFNDLNI